MPAPQLPPLPAAPPATQPAWQAVVNAFSQWRQILQGSKWQAPTLLNSWANYGSGNSPAGYRIDQTGRVWLRGSIAGGTSSTVAFVLPFGPQYQMNLTGFSGFNAAVAAQIAVFPNGNVAPYFDGGGAAVILALDGLSFDLSA